MAIYKVRGKVPQVSSTAYVALEATLIGDVVLAEHVSVWSGAVLRGDNERIEIGSASNIQEGAVLHVDPGFPMKIGQNVTIGHQAMLHGCAVGDGSLIGIQAVVLNGAVIGTNSLVAAGSVVTGGKVFPERSMIMGSPAKVVRELSEEEIARLLRSAAGYVERGALFQNELERIC